MWYPYWEGKLTLIRTQVQKYFKIKNRTIMVFIFLKRNSKIIRREAESINKAWALVTEESIKKWFKELQQHFELNNALDILEYFNTIFNRNESTFSQCSKLGKAFGPRGFTNLYSVKTEKWKGEYYSTDYIQCCREFGTSFRNISLR